MQLILGHFDTILAAAEDSSALRQAAVAQLFGPVIETNNRMAALLSQLEQINRDIAAQEVETGQATAIFLEIMALVVVAIGVIVSMVLGVTISANISKPIRTMVERLKQIAAGDLRGEPLVVRSRDEIGQAMQAANEMSQSLTAMISEVGTSAREVAGAATEIAASSEEMAQGMQEQTRQTTEVSSAIEQMSQTVVEVAQKSASAANTATEAGQQAENGGKVVQQTITGMEAIKQVVDESSTAIGQLGKRGEQIGAIIEVINDIADQTNLLALNAAIEAARAGEHGRGFAVVADEVRKLADRTTKATEEIAGSIQAIQTETSAAVEKMNVGTQRVAEGAQLADQAGEALMAIVTGSREVAGMIQSIAAGSEEQSAAAEQIARNVESINAVSQQAAEGASQAAAAAAQLSAKSEQLQQLVGQFKLQAQA
jgi:methyl-accepting chemotaxis protein